MNHLSDLTLDELAGRELSAPHLAECAACRARLEAFRSFRARSLASPRFEEIRASLKPPRRMRWVPFGLALAASLALALVVAPRLGPHERIKGKPFLQLVTARGESAGPVSPGARLGLTVNGAGSGYVLVVALAPDGGVSQLWPVHGEVSGAIPPGSARLEPPFEVTPGSAHLVALFSDAPLDAREVLNHPVTSTIPGERARAETDLVVEENSR
ncbi:MAG: hypothetical protein JST54_03445 [Deltaproteobacteria bacterium]|nr:hypothetical protein [Deltaproteobacteria bacterium]